MPAYYVYLTRTYATVVEAEDEVEAIQKAEDIEIGSWDEVNNEYDAIPAE